MREKTYTEERQWGAFHQYTHNMPTTVKILVIKPGALLSDQRHKQRSELWVPLDGGLYVVLDGQKLFVSPHQEIEIPAGTWHRVGCTTKARKPARILEVSFGHFDENDIERRDDIYGRV